MNHSLHILATFARFYWSVFASQEKIELLEKEKFSKLDVDTQNEIQKAKSETKSAKAVVVKLEKEKEELAVMLAADAQKVGSIEVEESSYGHES